MVCYDLIQGQSHLFHLYVVLRFIPVETSPALSVVPQMLTYVWQSGPIVPTSTIDTGPSFLISYQKDIFDIYFLCHWCFAKEQSLPTGMLKGLSFA